MLLYLLMICGFATAFSLFGHLPPLLDALVFSLTSFHGRGFFPGLGSETTLHSPLVVLAAVEAVIELFIEISFIATFTQEYAGKSCASEQDATPDDIACGILIESSRTTILAQVCDERRPSMRDIQDPPEQLEVHDPDILANARAVLDACRSPQEMQEAVLAAVARNEAWRGRQCLNLLAPEAPTSPTVRALLSAEVGIRAAEGHIGPVNRWFAGTQHIDEIEALCVELLKQVFRARYADHRLVASMIGNMAVYTALTEPGDVIMSLTQPFGGHSSNRHDGPAGVRGLKIVDIPFDPVELEVDLDLFRKMAPLVRPRLVALGASMTLFLFPLKTCILRQKMSLLQSEPTFELFS